MARRASRTSCGPAPPCAWHSVRGSVELRLYQHPLLLNALVAESLDTLQRAKSGAAAWSIFKCQEQVGQR